MTVRAKFYVSSLETRLSSRYDPETRTSTPVHLNVVKLQAVLGKGNEEWSAATPSGRAEMTITNPTAVGRFEVSHAYHLDFHRADDSEAWMPAPDVTVRAKFVVHAVEKTAWGEQSEHNPNPPVHHMIKLCPVSGEANKVWSDATPSGALEMLVTNPAAVAQFVLGADYFVDFTHAPLPAA